MSMRIGIIGCGTAGQAAGALLARAGHAVDVFERAPDLQPVGAGLLLQPTGMSVLDRVGVGERVRSLASPIDRLLGTDDRSRAVLDLRYSGLAEGLSGFGVQRGCLSAALLDVLRIEGVNVHLGSDVERVQQGRDAARLWLHGGADVGPFDVVVVADGARSRCRGALGGLVRRDRRYAWGAVWCMCELTGDIDQHTLRQSYRGTSGMVGFLPSGRLAPESPEMVSVFLSVKLDDWSASGGCVTAWRKTVDGLAPYASALTAQITSPEQLIVAPYFDVLMQQTSLGRVVCIGDSAHAMSPQLGQGVNLALLDAASLADRLKEPGDLGRAFAGHARDRRRSTSFYQRASRWLTPVFQSDLEALATVRDALLGRACAIKPLRRQMLLSLAGVKEGLLRSGPVPNGPHGHSPA